MHRRGMEAFRFSMLLLLLPGEAQRRSPACVGCLDVCHTGGTTGMAEGAAPASLLPGAGLSPRLPHRRPAGTSQGTLVKASEY